MSESTLNHHETARDTERRRVAHGWVRMLADDLLLVANQQLYAEFDLDTDVENAREMLERMTIADLFVPPGGQLGEVKSIFYEGRSDDPYDAHKLSLYYGHSLVIPQEPSDIFIAVSAEPAEDGRERSRYMAVGFEYISGNRTFRQLVGVVAGSDGSVDALRMAYANIDQRSIFSEGEARTICQNDTWMFVDYIRELFVLPRDKR
jgi:hypothetical protein